MERKAIPFLVYRLLIGSIKHSQRSVQFDSEVAWLAYEVPWSDIDIAMSDIVEPSESWYHQLLQRAKNDIHSQPWLVRRDLFPSMTIPENMGHVEVINLACRWLRNCSQSHECETLNGATDLNWCPKRLIDLSNLETPPRLLERQSELPNGRYAALSHCWGSDLDFIVLCEDNLDQFRQAIPPDLPQSFLDAIAICRHLGIPYLWIDCICILQSGNGSEEDWLLHTDEMALVYLNCCLNLSFDSAVGPKTGVFSDRNADFLQPCYLFSSIFSEMQTETGPDSDDGSTIQTGIEPSEEDPKFEEPLSDGRDRRYFYSRELAADFCDSAFQDGTPAGTAKLHRLMIVSSHDRLNYLGRYALLKRGWALQERLLAPRILHFTKDQILWECGNNRFLTESYPLGMNMYPFSHDHIGCRFNLPLRQDSSSQDLLSKEWTDFVRQYSGRNLTYPEKDKLAAISAIAQHFSAFFGEEYYAGHFLSQMPTDLVWRHIEGRYRASSALRAKVHRRFPTWSWTSVDGEVIHIHHFHHDFEVSALSEVLDVQTDLVDQAYKYGPVRFGSLRIRGLLLRCTFLVEYRGVDGPSMRCEFFIERDDNKTHKLNFELEVCLDNYEEDTDEVFYALPLVQLRSEGVCDVSGGILLRPSSRHVAMFERIGSFDTAINSNWRASNDRAAHADKQLTNFCQMHVEFARVVEII
ncbi:hypothetical protein GGR57DRAFT_462385 [Xylariaceae sp. FL1272]|nr:hypothetical protein GGR57DRAFT_462385 [Xylariaceae sp. FL1272]